MALPPVTVTWTLLGLQTDPPFGLFETPAAFTQNVSGAVPLTGWALDDVEVTRVQIWRQPHPSDPPAAIQQGIGGDPNPKVFIGDATMIDGARPDVEAVYFATAQPLARGVGLHDAHARAGLGRRRLLHALRHRD